MTKNYFIKKYASEMELNQDEARGIIDSVLDGMIQCVRENGEFVYPGFGRLYGKKKIGYTATSNLTGEEFTVPEKYVTRFTPYECLNAAVTEYYDNIQ